MTSGASSFIQPTFPIPLINTDNSTRQLEDKGVQEFNKPFEKSIETLAQRSPRHLMRQA